MVTVVNHTSSAQVIETYQNGKSGYRIYSDGYCEQWGYIDVPGTFTFLKTFKDTNYAYCAGFTMAPAAQRNMFVTAITSSSITIAKYSATAGASSILACGYLADGQY